MRWMHRISSTERVEVDSTLSFGYWLQRRRHALDLTQAELARRVGCSVELIRKIEADASTLAQAKFFRAAARLAFLENDNARSIALEEQALRLWEQIGDRVQIAESYGNIAVLARNLGALDRSHMAAEEALRLFKQVGDTKGIVSALLARGDIAFDLGDYPQARRLFQEGLALAQEHGYRRTAAVGLMTLARLARAEGDYGRAVTLYEESLAEFMP